MVDEYLIHQAFWLVILLSGVPILISTVLGLLVGVLQAATQIQEPSLLLLPKLVAVTLLLFFLGGGAFQAVGQLFEESVRVSASLGASAMD